MIIRAEPLLQDIVAEWDHLQDQNIFQKYYSEFYAKEMLLQKPNEGLSSRETRQPIVFKAKAIEKIIFIIGRRFDLCLPG